MKSSGKKKGNSENKGESQKITSHRLGNIGSFDDKRDHKNEQKNKD